MIFLTCSEYLILCVDFIDDSPLLEGLARVGLVAYGVVHVLIGWLTLKIAWGGTSGRSADISGALTTVADQPFGKVLLWLVAIGMVALALWQVSEAIWVINLFYETYLVFNAI
jgi:hypothetical protein